MGRWDKLSKHQLSEESRQFFYSELTRRGMRVYPVRQQPLEIHDAARRRWELVVRSSRNRSYSFVTKGSFPMADHRLFGLADYPDTDGAPQLFIIPLPLWRTLPGQLGRVLKSRDYTEAASAPEWGIDTRRELLMGYQLEQVVAETGGLFRFPTYP